MFLCICDQSEMKESSCVEDIIRCSCPTTDDTASSSVTCKGEEVVARGEGCSDIASRASIGELTYL